MPARTVFDCDRNGCDKENLTASEIVQYVQVFSDPEQGMTQHEFILCAEDADNLYDLLDNFGVPAQFPPAEITEADSLAANE